MHVTKGILINDLNNESHVFVVIRESWTLSSFFIYYTTVRLKGKNPNIMNQNMQKMATKQKRIGTRTVRASIHDLTLLFGTVNILWNIFDNWCKHHKSRWSLGQIVLGMSRSSFQIQRLTKLGLLSPKRDRNPKLDFLTIEFAIYYFQGCHQIMKHRQHSITHDSSMMDHKNLESTFHKYPILASKQTLKRNFVRMFCTLSTEFPWLSANTKACIYATLIEGKYFMLNKNRTKKTAERANQDLPDFSLW